jgi:hypothetical protein
MADAADSKSVGRKAVWVRLPHPAYLFFWLTAKLRIPAVLLGFQQIYSRDNLPTTASN